MNAEVGAGERFRPPAQGRAFRLVVRDHPRVVAARGGILIDEAIEGGVARSR